MDYWGLAVQQNTYGDARDASFTIDEHITKLLFGPANDAFRTQPVEIFQSALLHSFTRTFLDRSAPVVFNKGHGRETSWDGSIDISRTVGWFNTLWPTMVLVNKQHDIAETVRRTKDCRRRVPKNGWAYFASRYLNPKGKIAFKHYGSVELLLNSEGLL